MFPELPMMDLGQPRTGFPPIDLTIPGMAPGALQPGMPNLNQGMDGYMTLPQNVGTALAPQSAVAPPPNPFLALLDDKAFQMGLLTAGLNLLQPTPAGQSSLGHAASAIGSGVSTMAKTKEQGRLVDVENRKLGQTDSQIAQGQERIGLDRQRLGLEERRVKTAEELAAEEAATKKQDREQKAKAFPKTIAKLDAEVARLEAATDLDGEQAEFLREQIRRYPDKISAELKRANAAEISAGKPTGAEALLQATARAMVAGGQAKDENEAIAQLGGAHFLGKAGKKGDENKEYRDALLKFRENEGLMLPKGTDLNKYFDENIWNRKPPGSTSGGQANAQAPEAPRVVSRAQIAEAAKKRNVPEAAIIKALKDRGHKIEGEK